MKGLRFFTKTSSGSWNIASYHNPHSLTWSWLLNFSFFRADEGRWRPLWWSYPTNGGPHWGIRIPLVGLLHWQTQQPMYYRDLYVRKRDEEDQAAYRRSIVHQKQPVIVVDNSQALH